MESIGHIGRWLKCVSRLPGNTDTSQFDGFSNMGCSVFCVGSYRIILRGNISHPKGSWEDEFPVPLVGYVSSQEGEITLVPYFIQSRAPNTPGVKDKRIDLKK